MSIAAGLHYPFEGTDGVVIAIEPMGFVIFIRTVQLSGAIAHGTCSTLNVTWKALGWLLPRLVEVRRTLAQ